MKIWLDDLRPAPLGYEWCHSVSEAKSTILYSEQFCHRRPVDANERDMKIDLIDCDHDLGDYACDGGDGIELLKWLEKRGSNYPIRLHTMNIIGRTNMQAIIDHNNWTEVM